MVGLEDVGRLIFFFFLGGGFGLFSGAFAVGFRECHLPCLDRNGTNHAIGDIHTTNNVEGENALEKSPH